MRKLKYKEIKKLAPYSVEDRASLHNSKDTFTHNVMVSLKYKSSSRGDAGRCCTQLPDFKKLSNI